MRVGSLLTSVALSLAVASPALAVTDQERTALERLFAATGGPNWQYTPAEQLTHWFTDGLPECQWAGVSCNPAGTELQGIALGGHNLVGVLPPEIGLFAHLVTLEVSQNPGLGGQIPSEITQTTLENFFADGDGFTGDLSWIGGLPLLKKLSLRFNHLEGPIPATVGLASSLSEFQLEANAIGGSLPRELGTLSQLRLLNLTANRIQGSIPPELGNLSSLEQLRLDQNQLSGQLPDSLGSLGQLVVLVAGANELTGPLPPSLGNLARLRQLSIGRAHLSGVVPPSFGNLQRLEILSLGTDDLSGAIPQELGSLASLQELFLDNNHFLGEVPGSLGNLHSLRVLNLAGNALSGALSDQLLGMTALRSVDFGWNGLSAASEAVAAFLDARSAGDFELTQTIAPADVQVVSLGSSSVEVQWQPIAFTAHDGRYVISMAVSSDGPFSDVGATTDKTQRRFDVEGLDSGQQVFVRVRAVTAPHAANRNEVVSDPSAIASGSSADVSPGFLQFQLGVVAGVEGERRNVVVTRQNGSAGEVSADVVAVNGSARKGSDFRLVGQTRVRWAQGDNSPKTIAVELFQDGRAEPTESFTLELTNLKGGGLPGGTTPTATVEVSDPVIRDEGDPIADSGVELDVAEDGLGNRLVCWIGGPSGEGLVFAQAFDAAGVAVGGRTLISDRPDDQGASHPNVEALGPKEFLVAWEKGGVVRARKVSVGTNAIRVAPPPPANAGDKNLDLAARNGVAAVPGAQRALVVWVSARQVLGQFMNARGVLLGGPHRLDGPQPRLVSGAVAAFLSDGSEVLVSWEQTTPRGVAVYARAFDGELRPLSDEFGLDADGAIPQVGPRVTGGRSSFLLLWRRGPIDPFRELPNVPLNPQARRLQPAEAANPSIFTELVAANVGTTAPSEIVVLARDSFQSGAELARSPTGDCAAVWLQEQSAAPTQTRVDLVPACVAAGHRGSQPIAAAPSSARVLGVSLGASPGVTVVAGHDDVVEGDGGLTAIEVPEQ